MTYMHLAEFESNSVYSCHWLLVNDTNAYSWVWIKLNDTNACTNVIDRGSMTWMHSFVSLTAVNDTNACTGVIDHGQWHECMQKCHWPWSMTRMHASVSLTIWSMTRMRASVSLTTVHSCHWLGLNYSRISCLFWLWWENVVNFCNLK